VGDVVGRQLGEQTPDVAVPVDVDAVVAVPVTVVVEVDVAVAVEAVVAPSVLAVHRRLPSPSPPTEYYPISIVNCYGW
jgi:hypothetical protein